VTEHFFTQNYSCNNTLKFATAFAEHSVLYSSPPEERRDREKIHHISLLILVDYSFIYICSSVVLYFEGAYFFPSNGSTAPWGPRPPHFSRLHDHTFCRHTTLGRTPLDEGPARRRGLYLTTHNTHMRQTSIP
jgi:hypothetical protein